MSDDLERRLRRIDFQGEREVAEKLRQVTQRTVDNQIRSRNNVNAKALRTLRHNVLLTGVLLTALSFVAKSPKVTVVDFLNGYVGVGVTALLLSSCSAALTYGRTDVAVGIESGDVADVLELDLTNEQFQEVVVKSYATWMESNAESHAKKAFFANLTVAFLVVAIAYLSLGTYAGVVGRLPGELVAGANVLLVLVTWHIGLLEQLRRALRRRGR
jgi:hypothetical protein